MNTLGEFYHELQNLTTPEWSGLQHKLT